ncbi:MULTISPECIES: hypothetical protein [unclassified Streptomyces]|uniref:SbtR family transcriptional regulator n=1 Tax=unclassified Streptomyces TaxID=2593676 RepID=UPI0030786E0A
MLEDLLADGAREGSVRGDVAPAELASYCLHALGAAGALPSQAAAHRLVAVTLSGVRPAAASGAEVARRTVPLVHPPHRSGHRHVPGSPGRE